MSAIWYVISNTLKLWILKKRINENSKGYLERQIAMGNISTSEMLAFEVDQNVRGEPQKITR